MLVSSATNTGALLASFWSETAAQQMQPHLVASQRAHIDARSALRPGESPFVEVS